MLPPYNRLASRNYFSSIAEANLQLGLVPPSCAHGGHTKKRGALPGRREKPSVAAACHSKRNRRSAYPLKRMHYAGVDDRLAVAVQRFIVALAVSFPCRHFGPTANFSVPRFRKIATLKYPNVRFDGLRAARIADGQKSVLIPI